MNSLFLRLAFFVTALLAAAPAHPQTPIAPKPPAAFSVTRSQSSIDTFLAADQANPPPHGAILFIGSSIFRKWDKLVEQMAPLPVFNRAFGGSRTPEVLYYVDAIVLPYAPKIIVYYCGSNDINADTLPPAIAANFEAFVDRVHARLPRTRILFASILRAPQKQDRWDRVEAANSLVRDFCAQDPRLLFIDINPAVFDQRGAPRWELYLPDHLHYLPPAYVGFTAIIRPILEKTWAEAGAPDQTHR